MLLEVRLLRLGEVSHVIIEWQLQKRFVVINKNTIKNISTGYVFLFLFLLVYNSKINYK